MPLLKVHQSDGRASQIPIEAGAVTLGRGPENDVVLDGHGISRQHALLTVESDSVAVWDAGSKNGTWYRRRRRRPRAGSSEDGWQRAPPATTRPSVLLRDGDEVRLGDVRLVIEGTGEEPEPPRATDPGEDTIVRGDRHRAPRDTDDH